MMPRVLPHLFSTILTHLYPLNWKAPCRDSRKALWRLLFPAKLRLVAPIFYSPPFGCAGAATAGAAWPKHRTSYNTSPLFPQCVSGQGWRFYGWGGNRSSSLCWQEILWNHRLTLKAIVTVTGFLTRITEDYF